MKGVFLLLILGFGFLWWYRGTQIPGDLVITSEEAEGFSSLATRKKVADKAKLRPVVRPTPTSVPIKKVALKKKPKVMPKKQELPPGVIRVRPFKEDEIPVDLDGNLVLSEVFVSKEGRAYIQGDILIGNITKEEIEKNPGKPLLLPPPKKWDQGVIPYEIDSSVPDQNRIQEALNMINDSTSLKIIPKRDWDKNFVRFVRGEENCYANLGMIGGEQEVVLSDSCQTGHILHELMHTAGLLHEQNREDRDEYLEIHWQNIDEKHQFQFKKIKNDFLDLSKFPFDFDSIMLYGPQAFTVDRNEYTMTRLNGEPYESQHSTLSPKDIERINFLYGEN